MCQPGWSSAGTQHPNCHPGITQQAPPKITGPWKPGVTSAWPLSEHGVEQRLHKCRLPAPPNGSCAAEAGRRSSRGSCSLPVDAQLGQPQQNNLPQVWAELPWQRGNIWLSPIKCLVWGQKMIPGETARRASSLRYRGDSSSCTELLPACKRLLRIHRKLLRIKMALLQQVLVLSQAFSLCFQVLGASPTAWPL